MGCLGSHVALSTAQENRLLDAFYEDEEPVIGAVHAIENEAFEAKEWCQELDKAWDPIHRALTDGTLRYDCEETPLSLAILGGMPLYHGDDYIVVYLNDEEVTELTAALRAVDKQALRRGYDRIDPAQYAARSDEDFDYVWLWFEKMQAFFARAAAAGRATVFFADQ